MEPDFERSCARYASDGVRGAECEAQLQLARDTAAKYRDPAVALGDQFVPGECVDAAAEGDDPALGAMGEHWIRIDRMADEELDVREPEELLYINTPQGRRLVGAEWQIAAFEGGVPHYGNEPPDPSRTAPAPEMFGGRVFDGPMQGHNLVQAWPSDVHLTPQPWHYDLHVWLWEHNPAGIFARYNPAINCTGAAGNGRCNGAAAIGGTDGPDDLRGASGRDSIHTQRGNDKVRGYGGADTLCGGRGHDLVSGGEGKDIVKGNRGSDFLRGGPGFDICRGGRGRDVAARSCEVVRSAGRRT